MRNINERTVPGTWRKIAKDEWEMDAGKGWSISVSKDGNKYQWEVSGRKHSSRGMENSRYNAQTIGIKQYQQVREDREVGMYRDASIQGTEPDTKERFQRVGRAELDDFGLIKKINRRNQMRAMNLLKGKSPVDVTMGESSEDLHERTSGLDPDQERMLDEIVVTARNEGDFYRKNDPKGAIDFVIKGYLKSKMQTMRHDAQVIRKRAIAELKRNWKLDEDLDEAKGFQVSAASRVRWMGNDLDMIEENLRGANDAFKKLKKGKLSKKVREGEIYNLETSMSVIEKAAGKMSRSAKDLFK